MLKHPGRCSPYSYGCHLDGTSDQLIKTRNGTREPDGVEGRIQQNLDRRTCAR
ncbi:hypothetical protein AB0N14_36300 [Streptomyces sp. NPDC051104]|uniref:hypothetical protein n=1 Tax=Streptomyces sp. NPDC051104 TaxID=3155044 RepID=UPI003412B18C